MAHTMIGGFQKQSFIDWNGRTVAVVFTKGCNFRCGYCHNPALVLPHLMDKLPHISTHSILEFLGQRVGWLDGVVVTGGEPTIHAELPRFLAQIRELGMGIKLDTNGTNPSMVQKLISNQLIDYVAMDVKTILRYADYQKITCTAPPNVVELVSQTLDILRSSRIAYQLRTTLVPAHHPPAVVEQLKALLKNHPHVFQDYRAGDNVDCYCDG